MTIENIGGEEKFPSQKPSEVVVVVVVRSFSRVSHRCLHSIHQILPPIMPSNNTLTLLLCKLDSGFRGVKVQCGIAKRVSSTSPSHQRVAPPLCSFKE